MRITSGGSIGIGTATPNNYALAVEYNAGSTSVMTMRNTSTSGFSGIHFLNNTGSLMAHIGYANTGTLAGFPDAVYFGSITSKPVIFTSTDIERMRITAAGNIGIGTSSPVTETGHTSLTINGSSIARIDQYVGGTSIGLLFSSSTFTMLQTTGANPLLFGTSGAERMRISSDGSIGINGVPNPDSGDIRVQVNGGQYGTLNLRSTSVNGIIRAHNPNGVFYVATASNHPIAFVTNDAERMRITSAGFVGIGTNPGYTFHVYNNADVWHMVVGTANGQIRFGGETASGAVIQSVTPSGSARNLFLQRDGGNVSIGDASNSGYKLYVAGAIYATGNIVANSDFVLKKNLKLVDNPIDKLNQLNGYLYQWKENDEYQYGVIAQEVEKILPHAVTTGTKGIKGVAYNQLIPVMIEAIKEQNKKIIALEAKLG